VILYTGFPLYFIGVKYLDRSFYLFVTGSNLLSCLCTNMQDPSNAEQNMLNFLKAWPNFSFRPYCDKPTVRLRNYIIRDASGTHAPFFDGDTSDGAAYIHWRESERLTEFDDDDKDAVGRKLFLEGDIWSWDQAGGTFADYFSGLPVYKWYVCLTYCLYNEIIHAIFTFFVKTSLRKQMSKYNIQLYSMFYFSRIIK